MYTVKMTTMHVSVLQSVLKSGKVRNRCKTISDSFLSVVCIICTFRRADQIGVLFKRKIEMLGLKDSLVLISSSQGNTLQARKDPAVSTTHMNLSINRILNTSHQKQKKCQTIKKVH